MNNGCCSKCQAKAAKKKKKNSKKIKEEFDEEDVKQNQKVSENENMETDSDEENEKKKKNNDILTWRHPSLKKEKGSGKNLLSEKNGDNPPYHTARSMTYNGGPNCSNPPYHTARSMTHHGGPNFLSQCPIPATPRGRYPPFSMPPMYGPYGGGGGPIQPYQYMPQGPMFNGVHISPYPPMAAVAPPPYWQPRPFRDTNPMTKYTSYADNYSFCFI